MTGYPNLVVLVVDDDPNCREVLARLLSKVARCRVVEAGNGAEGFNVVAAERPDLIFLDLMMPEVDGKEMLGQIRAHPDLSDIPVIVCSAMDELDHVKGIIELGILDYVLKPYSLDTLFAKLKAALEKISTRPRSRRSAEAEARSPQPERPPAVRKLLLVTDDLTLVRQFQASVDPTFCCFHAQDRATAINVATAERPEAIFLVSPLGGGEERNLARELRSLTEAQSPKLFRIFSTSAVDVHAQEECDGSFILTSDHGGLFEWIHQCLGPGPFPNQEAGVKE
ncbi:MAG: two-component system response regulator [Candidatus Methylomirabilales bacterium]